MLFILSFIVSINNCINYSMACLWCNTSSFVLVRQRGNSGFKSVSQLEFSEFTGLGFFRHHLLYSHLDLSEKFGKWLIKTTWIQLPHPFSDPMEISFNNLLLVLGLTCGGEVEPFFNIPPLCEAQLELASGVSWWNCKCASSHCLSSNV